MNSFRQHKPATRRGAILTMELVLVLPVFMLLLFAIVEFSLLSSAQNRITEAAQTGVRQLCITNKSPDDIRESVKRQLGPKLASQMKVDVVSPADAGELANVRITIPMKNATPDLLWLTGFSVSDRVLSADAPMIREHDSIVAHQNKVESSSTSDLYGYEFTDDI